MATTTANMGLSVPSVNDTDYPTSISDSFNAIDDHDHSSGNGVQIPSSGILDGAVGTSKLATNAVTTIKITDGNVTEAKIATSAVTTTKIADANVTEGKIAANAVTTTKIADSNVTTAKIADANVTPAKLSSANSNQGASSGGYVTTNTSYTTAATVTITPRGRALILMLEPDAVGAAEIIVEGAGLACRASIVMLKDGSPIGEWKFGGAATVGVSQVSVPASAIIMTDRVPGSSAVTYTVQAKIDAGSGSTSMAILNARLAAIEIF